MVWLLKYHRPNLITWHSCSVWHSCSKKDSQRLQRLFNYGCRLALNKDRRYSASALHADLGLTTLEKRRKLHLAQMVFKCLSGLAPPYLASLFHSPTHHHNTRTRSLINLPQTKTSSGQKAFSFAGASIWRTLPSSAREAQSLHHFSNIARNVM